MTISKKSGPFGGRNRANPTKLRSRMYWEGIWGPRTEGGEVPKFRKSFVQHASVSIYNNYHFHRFILHDRFLLTTPHQL